MRWKRFLLVGITLLALLFVLPWLVPMGAYTREIEQMASAKLGHPVTIGSLHLALLPSPRVNIGQLRVGHQGEVNVETVSVVPELSSLLSEGKVVSDIVIRHATVKRSGVELLSSLPAVHADSDPAKIHVRHIRVSDLRPEWEGLELPALDAELILEAGHQLRTAHLSSTDGRFKADITSRGQDYVIRIEARQWIPPAGPRIVFDMLTADLGYTGASLKLHRVDANFLQGRLFATGQLDWKKSWHVSGNFQIKGIELGDVARQLRKPVKLTGRLSGTGTFKGSARQASQLGDALTLDYRFNVAEGVLHGVDLTQAASLLVRHKQSGGETHFDELSGTLHLRSNRIEIQPLHIVSGLLTAEGHVRMTPDRKLGGRVDAKIKKDVALVTIPLEISGTVDAPLVMPTKAALAGAAAGTALMGPLGADLGMKAGTALDKLFGGGK
jgi:hypothetical protein